MPATVKVDGAVAERKRQPVAGANAVLVGEGLADDGAVAAGQRAQDGVAVLAGQEAQAAVAAHDFDIAGAQRGALAAIVEFRWRGRRPPRRRPGWRPGCAGTCGGHAADIRPRRERIAGAHVEIGAQLHVEPQRHGLAEAAHHDADAGHHGDGGGQRRHHHRGARERCRQAARRPAGSRRAGA